MTPEVLLAIAASMGVNVDDVIPRAKPKKQKDEYDYAAISKASIKRERRMERNRVLASR
jgi:hypothetical protein